MFKASNIVLPGNISEAIAAEWVIPEHPTVSTNASSITPPLTFKVNLQAPCWGAHQPIPWVNPEISDICVACTHFPSTGIGAHAWLAHLETTHISSTSLEYIIILIPP